MAAQTTPAGDWLGLAGTVQVVTGAASGIGAGITRALAAAGADVALLDRNLADCEALARELEDLSGQRIALACDIADEAQVRQAAAAVEEALGPCQGLVNGAGILRPGGLAEVSLDDWNAVLSVNLTGYLLCARAFGQPMRDRERGSIVHIASISASQPQTWSGAYSASKAAVAILSRQLAAEWGPQGVRSNCVSPGMIRTELSAAFYAQPGVTVAREAFTASRRIGEPEDIANAVLFLLSERAGYVNGAELGVDGGLPCMLMDKVPRPGFSAD
ncbi:SDR family NAD(P)-dependent oxidoreductase [Halomonas urumqiensis]|uniref:2-deoxy-D-gluconate 3-dehydrogenase n=1 Tax=Halomonas urumqiensis TaxID=1684789 RepID=A0A2N7UJ38_9GAMM|nr:SDR family NAD(P)-dependent oxidoreductase [Halomonas urumqiensis]PMR80456.1 2-deoxy-D-gluconate 3-dehydrogenase [Halomonas urumqiensis]PTB01699.1 SDR family NAD(P)-dependent oxidoreductase [Halomonas urumqiensis]GHE22208.1 oxidoreductase [Halomonas urumqiensis]